MVMASIDRMGTRRITVAYPYRNFADSSHKPSKTKVDRASKKFCWHRESAETNAPPLPLDPSAGPFRWDPAEGCSEQRFAPASVAYFVFFLARLKDGCRGPLPK